MRADVPFIVPVLVVSAVAIGLAACGSDAGPKTVGAPHEDTANPKTKLNGRPVKGPAVVSTVDGLDVVIAGATDGAMDMKATGVLTKVGTCLGLTIGTTEMVAIWPSGTIVDREGDVAVQLPSGVQAKLGETVRVSGGILAANEGPNAVPDTSKRCTEANERILISSAE